MPSSRRRGLSAAGGVLLSAALSAALSAGLLAAPATAATRVAPAAPAVKATLVTAPAAAKQPFPGKSATQIKKISAGVAAKARTVHAAGYDIDPSLGRISFDMVIAPNGAKGWIRLVKKKATAQLIRVGNTIYLQPDARFGGPDFAPGGALYGTWIRVPRTQAQYKQIVPITVISSWAKLIGSLTVSRRTDGGTMGGTPTVRLYQPGAKGGSIYVATAGPAFPRLVATSDKTVRYALYDWNKAVAPITAPPADQLAG